MYGILTNNPTIARDSIGSVAYYIADGVSGRRRAPVEGTIISVACWGDTAAVRDDPSRVARSEGGTRALPTVDGHHWGTVCPTDPDYQTELLDRIGAVGNIGAVRLTTPGFPGSAFCRCDRCDRQFATSTFDDRQAWRTETITQFVREASTRVDEDLIVTLYPDPYPGNLRERTGLDPQRLAPHVDGFLVPLCSISYETTYWVESLARGFARELGALDVPLTIQLSASEATIERLVDVTRQIDPYADSVVYGTDEDDVDTIREVISRCRTTEPLSPTV